MANEILLCPGCGEHPNLCFHPEQKMTLYCECEGFNFETEEVDSHEEAVELWEIKVNEAVQ